LGGICTDQDNFNDDGSAGADAPAVDALGISQAALKLDMALSASNSMPIKVKN
jgi:hypothetical protein